MMKKLLFFILTLSLSFNTIFAQDANEAYKNAKKAFSVAATAENDKRTEKLEEASVQIDIATAGINQFDAKTLPKVWLKSAEIYSDLANRDFALGSIPGSEYTPKHPEASFKAFDAYKATLEIPDLKKYNKTEALDGLKRLSTFLSNDGSLAFNDKDYKKAYECFTALTEIDKLLTDNKKESLFENPEKRNDNLFAQGLSAFAAEMQPEAKAAYEQLKNEGYQKPEVYEILSKVYTQEGESEKALAILEEGREKYPEDERLRLSEIDYYLQANKLDVLTSKLESAIKADPKNVTLYATLGHVYENLSQREYKEGNIEMSDKYFDLAYQYYIQALEIDGAHFNTIFNTGALYYNKAAQTTRELLEMGEDYSTAGLRKAEEKRSEMMSLFDQALPYFKRAEAIDPNDIGTLSALQEIYARKDDLNMAKEFKTRLEKVQSGSSNDTSYFNK